MFFNRRLFLKLSLIKGTVFTISSWMFWRTDNKAANVFAAHSPILMTELEQQSFVRTL